MNSSLKSFDWVDICVDICLRNDKDELWENSFYKPLLHSGTEKPFRRFRCQVVSQDAYKEFIYDIGLLPELLEHDLAEAEDEED